MQCDYCKTETPMTMIRFLEDGQVPGIVGMKRHRAQCVECAKGIDNTSKKTIDREPGSDDDWIG